jgi:polyisoprenoid-binding protein YceI
MTTRNMIIAVTVVAVLIIGGVAWSFLAPAEAPSAPIAAVPIQLSPSAEVAEPTEAPAEPTAEPEPTEVEATPDPYANATATTEVAAVPTEAPAEPTAEPTTAPAAAPIIFEIEQASSEARFSIDEVLNGSPKTVIGVTSQVAGQIAVDPANPTSAQVGIIQINARDFTTDSDNRNNAIKNRILRTNEFEFITFTPTAISGLPESAGVGETISFQVTGDLTMLETTRSVTFDVTLTPVSDTELNGTASATILYPDWGIQIPQVPQVAGVDEDVILELVFTARPVA